MVAKENEIAIELLANAARTHDRVEALPASGKPASIAEALLMQEQLLSVLGKPVGGFKVATNPSGVPMWGAILADDIRASPATLDGTSYAPMGVEGEIAFRLDRDLPQRMEAYSRAEIEAALTALPIIEVVSSRFKSYQDTPIVDRLVDRMSNGALILGKPRPDWRDIDLSRLRVTLTCDGIDLVDRIGGHSRVDPLLPVIEFVNAVQSHKSLKAGEIIAAGTLTDLLFAKPGQHYVINFHDFGQIELTFER
jgi:2-keto-4-pentenoate hydratase